MSSMPYRRSWIDRLLDRVDRSRLPVFAFYVLLYLVGETVIHAAEWVDGVRPIGEIDRLLLVDGFILVAPLGFIHGMETVARRALAQFVPTLEDQPEQVADVTFGLTEMPARPVFWLSAVSAVVTAVGVVTDSVQVYEGLDSPMSRLITVIPVAFAYSTGMVAFYFAFRMLRTVSKAYALVDEVNVLDQRPLYSLSKLTMIAGVVFLLFVTSDTLIRPFVDAPDLTLAETVANVLGTGAGMVLAVALALGPLRGIHRRLREAKYDLIQENARAIDRMRVRLYATIQSDDRSVGEKTDVTLGSLFQLRDELEAVPTWPWRPGSFRAFLTAIVVPIVVWAAQYGLAALL